MENTPKTPTPGTVLLVSLLIAIIDENPNNPRQDYDLEELQSLGRSLLKRQRTPIRVFAKDNGRYGLIGGHRRLRAARMVGLETLQALVEPEPTSDEMLIEDQLIEQIHNKDTSTAEKLDALLKVARMRNKKAEGEKIEAEEIEALLEDLDADPSTTSKARTILGSLSETLLGHFLSARIGFSLAYEIARVPDHAVQARLAEDVMAGRLKRSSLIKVIKGYEKPGKQAKQPVEIIDEKSKSKTELKGPDKNASARAMIDLLKRWIAENGIPGPSAN